MISKIIVNYFVWNHWYFEKFDQKWGGGGGGWREIYYKFMYIAPSSDWSLLTLDLPFKVILRRFKVVFWCLEWECCTFQKIDENSFKWPSWHPPSLYSLLNSPVFLGLKVQRVKHTWSSSWARCASCGPSWWPLRVWGGHPDGTLPVPHWTHGRTPRLQNDDQQKFKVYLYPKTSFGRFRTGMYRTTYTILQHFPLWWHYIKMKEAMFCCHTKYYMTVIWSHSQLEWFILFLWNRWKIVICLRDAKKTSTPQTFILSILLPTSVSSRQPVDILVLWANYETNLHFIFVWSYMNISKFSSMESPFFIFERDKF